MMCAVNDDVPPPYELELAWQCMRWGALPCVGGLEDQPAGLMRMLTIVANVYDSFKEFMGVAPGLKAEWVEKNPAKWQLICEVELL